MTISATTDGLARAVSTGADLAELIRHALGHDPALPAIEFEGRWYDWGEIKRTAAQVRHCLARTGAGRLQPVAFIARNRPWAIGALLGMIADERTIQMVYAFQAAPLIARNIAALRPAVVVCEPEQLSAELVEVMGREGIAGIVLEEQGVAALDGLEHALRSDDEGAPVSPQIQILTSGTTGPPKQHPFSYELFARHHILPALAGEAGDFASEPPVLLMFPLGNITGMFTTLPALVRGQRCVLVDRFSIDAWHDWVLRYRPENGGLPPAGLQMILDRDIPPEDLASIRFIGTGAAPLDPTVQRTFEERYGIPVLLSYGATEFGGPVTAMTPALHAEWGKAKFGSVGRPLPGVQLRVVDPETGQPLPPGKEGLLEVVSPRIGPDWIRTADVAVIDADGFLFHCGRADGAIIRGGFKIIPEGIERALLLHPAVAAAAVVGRPDSRLGEVPVAVIQTRPGVRWPGADALEAHVREHVPAPHVPVDWRQVDDIPRNRSMKTDRPAIRALFATDR